MTDHTPSPTRSHSSPTPGIDGQDFKDLVKAALSWLKRHQNAVNKLNVYPVPDGDTGTNMVLTMQSAWEEIQETENRNIGQVAHQMSHGALMGARGNSGVILSQVWRGFARSMDEKSACRARDLADACQEATATAYKGVVKPVEGTILTVSRAVSDAANTAAKETDNLVHILEQMVLAAHEAVVLTPSLLPVLAEAGVVDAGGQGLFIILEGMLRHVRGQSVGEGIESTEGMKVSAGTLEPEIGYGYDVQFLIVGEGLELETIREKITSLGECPLVVGDRTTAKVHVHVPDPGIPISYGASQGSLRDVVVEDMQAQYQEFSTPQAEGATGAGNQTAEGIGVVAVVMGEGIAHVFESLGAGKIVHGGQTMNPSTQDLLEAVDNLPNEQVILLPNNSNVTMAAEQASALSDKDVAVVPSRFIPQGVTALLAFNPQSELEANVKAMKDMMGDVETGEITTATRSAKINGTEVEEGDIIGIHNGDLAVAGQSTEKVAQPLLEKMGIAEREIVTLYYGETVEKDEANALAEQIRAWWPEQEIEVIDGGQPHYHYIVSVE